ncbi:uncharacterized protein TRAVEDRAFT_94514, partial [Trametes versicolor FP-101664 SS1]|uniref:uncharacterized protein n=1 Tax=Trametes versicolor (strain FP-101664) TaxID=717944 RepID=UPI0004622BEA
PEWVTDATRYFALIKGGERWKRLMDNWLEFENLLLQDTSNRLAKEFRPDEVRLWMKNHRLYEKLPKIKSPKQFSVSWKRWWVSLQPSLRTNDEAWPLPRSEPVNPSDWDIVARGGCNGLFLVVLTLAWW